MKAAIFASALAALGASAAPLKRQMASGGPTTTQVLQYALTLENLENTF